MYETLQQGHVSKQMIYRLDHIPPKKLLRYRNLSTSLQEDIRIIGIEFAELNKDLKKTEMWRKPFIMSTLGLQRWKKSIEVLSDCLGVKPDPEWRENWEKKKMHPYCTRKEAELLALDYVLKDKGLDLHETDPDNDKNKYYYSQKVKNGIFTMKYGAWNKGIGAPMQDIGAIEIDMLSREIKI